MRKRYALVALIPACIVAACEESSTTTGQQPGLDGGPTLESGAAPDSPVTGSDVTVSVTRRGVPAQGVVVVFQDASGTVIASETTSAAGTVVRAVPAGSQVTVVMGTPALPNLLTIVDVEPGDVLAANDPGPLEDQQTATLRSLPLNEPGNEFEAFVGNCRAGSIDDIPTELTIGVNCHQNGTFPVFVAAISENNVAGFTFKKGNTFIGADGGVIVPDVAPTQAWSTTLATHTIRLQNVAANMQLRTAFSEIADGIAMPSDNGVYAEEPGSVDSPHRWHPGYPDAVQSEVARIDDVVDDAGIGRFSVSATATREAVPAANATTTLDLNALLPHITTAAIDATDKGRPTVVWTTATPIADADGALVHLTWNGTGDPAPEGTWTFVLPPSKTSVKVPALPESVANFAPRAADTELVFGQPPTITIVDASFIQGYRDARKLTGSLSARAAADWSRFRTSNMIPPLPSAGTLRATAYTSFRD